MCTCIYVYAYMYACVSSCSLVAFPEKEIRIAQLASLIVSRVVEGRLYGALNDSRQCSPFEL